VGCEGETEGGDVRGEVGVLRALQRHGSGLLDGLGAGNGNGVLGEMRVGIWLGFGLGFGIGAGFEQGCR